MKAEIFIEVLVSILLLSSGELFFLFHLVYENSRLHPIFSFLGIYYQLLCDWVT